MTEVLAGLLDLWRDQAVIFGLVFLRMGAMMALLPAFGEHSVPLRVRLVLGLAFTVLVMPAVDTRFAPLVDVQTLLSTGGTEVLAGLALGILFRLVVVALQMAGTIAANVTSLAQIFGGASADPQPGIAHILMIAGLALAAMAGLHVKLVAAMIASYDMMPPGQLIAPDTMAEWGTRQVADAFSLAFSLSAPFLVVSVIYNLALGAINRAMPQLMVAFVGAPAITAAGLMMMLIASPFLLRLWLAALDGTLAGLGAG